MKIKWILMGALLPVLLLSGCGSDSATSENSDPIDNTEPDTIPDPDETNTAVVEDISDQFQTEISENVYVLRYTDSQDNTHVAMIPRMARFKGNGILKVESEQLHAIQIVDGMTLTREFSNIALPFITVDGIQDISNIISEELNIELSQIYAVSKSSAVQYMGTEDEGFDNSYKYWVNGQESILRLNASDYPVARKIPFPGVWEGAETIELGYEQENTPYFKITVRLFANGLFIKDVPLDIYFKGTLTKVSGSTNHYEL